VGGAATGRLIAEEIGLRHGGRNGKLGSPGNSAGGEQIAVAGLIFGISPDEGMLHGGGISLVEDRAAGHDGVVAIFEEKADGGSFQDLTAGEIHPATADDFDEGFFVGLDGADDGVLACEGVLDDQAGNGAVFAIDEANAGAEFFVAVVGVVAERVGAERNTA